MNKCNYCKEDKTKELGIIGKWNKTWNYCSEHYLNAKTERDSYLVKKGHPIYDKVIKGSVYLKEFLGEK